MINRHIRAQEAIPSSAARSNPLYESRICYCTLHPDGLRVSRTTYRRHLERDRKNGVIPTVVERDILLDDSDAETSRLADFSDDDSEQTIPQQLLMQIDTNNAEFDDTPVLDDNINSQMDWDVDSDGNNFGEVDGGDADPTDDEAEDAALLAQMSALAVGDENDDHFTMGNTDIEDEIIPQGALVLLVKKILTNINPEDLQKWIDWVLTIDGITRTKQSEIVQFANKHYGILFPSTYGITKRLKEITKLEYQFYDVCPNSCMAYTGKYKDLDRCTQKIKLPKGKTRPCEEARYHAKIRPDGTRRPRKQMLYISILARLNNQFRNRSQAETMTTYRASFDNRKGDDCQDDVFAGDLYQKYHRGDLGLFKRYVCSGLMSLNSTDLFTPTDVAGQTFMDGANVTNIGTHEITPFLIANLNLPPEIRYLLANIMCVFLIPGPRKYGLLDSFFLSICPGMQDTSKGSAGYLQCLHKQLFYTVFLAYSLQWGWSGSRRCHGDGTPRKRQNTLWAMPDRRRAS